MVDFQMWNSWYTSCVLGNFLYSWKIFHGAGGREKNQNPTNKKIKKKPLKTKKVPQKQFCHKNILLSFVWICLKYFYFHLTKKKHFDWTDTRDFRIEPMEKWKRGYSNLDPLLLSYLWFWELVESHMRALQVFKTRSISSGF